MPRDSLSLLLQKLALVFHEDYWNFQVKEMPQSIESRLAWEDMSEQVALPVLRLEPQDMIEARN